MFSTPTPQKTKQKQNKRHNSIGGFSFPSAYSLATGQFGGSGYYYVAGAPGFSNLNGVVGSVRGCSSHYIYVFICFIRRIYQRTILSVVESLKSQLCLKCSSLKKSREFEMERNVKYT